MRRWIKRGLLGVLAIVVIVVGGVVILLDTSFGRDLLRRRIEATLENSFPGGAHVGKLEGSVFGELVVHDLELDGLDHQPLLVVGTVRIELALRPLASRLVRVDRLTLEDVVVHVPPRSPTPPPSQPSSPSTWSIELPDVAIHRGKVIRGDVVLTELEATSTARMPAGGALDAVVAVRGKWHDRPIGATALVRYEHGVGTAPLVTAFADRARLSAIGIRITDGKTLEGSIAATIPADTMRVLAGVDVPGDAAVGISARAGGFVDALVTMGDREVRAVLQGDAAALEVRGLLIATDPELGTGVAAVELSPDRVHGIVSASALFDESRVAIAIDGSLDGGWLVAGGRGKGIRGGLFAQLTRKGPTWLLARSHLVARARNLGELRGDVDLSLRATGRAWPDPDLRVDGLIDGDDLRYGQLGMAGMDLALVDVRNVPKRPTGTIRVAIAGARDGAVALGSVKLDADALVDGDRTVIDLDSHKWVSPGGATWAGTGGRLVVGHDRLVLDKLHTANGPATIDIDATFAKRTGDLTAHLETHELALASIVPGVTGTGSGAIDVARRAGSWTATGAIHGSQLVVDGHQLDADVDLHVDGRRAKVHGTATGDVGDVAVDLDVEGPRDLTDADAWFALDRKALRDASIAITRLDLAKLGGSGLVAGELAISGTGAHGTLHVHAVHTRPGDVDAELALAAGPHGEVTATGTAHLAGLATGELVARLGLPARPFDPAAWRSLGRGALRGATARLDELAFDPGVLAKLHVVAPYRGRIAATAVVSSGAASTTATVVVHELRGGAIAEPIDVAIHGTLDAAGLAGSLDARTGTTALLAVNVRAPIDLARGVIATAPLAGVARIPATPARELLAVFGHTGVTGGTVDGTIELGGTLGAPTAHAVVTARDVTVPAGVAGRKPSTLSELALDARWTGSSGELELSGRESSGGTLHVTARGAPATPSSVTVAVAAVRFDLAPLAAFAPGPLVDGSGTLDAALDVHGVDPQTGEVRGELHLRDARVPLSSEIGTLHRASLDVAVADHRVTAKLVGKLGAGDVTATGTLALGGASPAKADVAITLRQVSPVAAIEPVISADVTGHFEPEGATWTGDVKVRNASVVIPSTERDALLDAGAPSDIAFVDGGPPEQKLMHRPPPNQPWLIARIDLRTTVDADNLQDIGSGHLVVGGKLTISVGDGIGFDGVLDTERGDVEVLGRAYQVDHASVVFDGTLDPLLNVRLLHDFTDVTLMADVSGRASEPDLHLSSDPGIYTDGQLLGFFLGGEPGGDPSSASRDAATGAGASFLSTKVGTRVKRVLPVKVDVLTYDAGTSTTSGAVRVGTWLSRKLFVQYKSHPEARPDENSNEGDVEYYLPSNWFLQGTAGDRGIGGVDLLHRWRW